ncbi:hypothetical protein FACS1894124_7430 [Spirochaetia bacterium]|nr:hypothetical protein FACS1894124_7430 [Spirochaetia bacterium]
MTELLREEFRLLKNAAHTVAVPPPARPVAPWLADGAVPEWLTVNELAEALKVTPWSVR